MPVGRRKDEANESAIWIFLTALWAASAIVAWCSGLLTPEPHTTASSTVTLLGLAVVLISAALRLPVLSKTPRGSLRSDHLVWLLACAANIHWLGFLSGRCELLYDAIPTFLLVACSEVGLYSVASHHRQLPWLRLVAHRLRRQLTNLFGAADLTWTSEKPSAAPDAVQAQSAAGQRATDDWPADSKSTPQGARQDGRDGEAPDDRLGANLDRRTVQGTDENGQNFLSGEIRVRLAENQQTESIVVGFCPAFEGDPDVDLECELDGVSVRLVHCTPAGMRIAVRRARSSEKASFSLQWYATQSTPVDVVPGFRDGLP